MPMVEQKIVLTARSMTAPMVVLMVAYLVVTKAELSANLLAANWAAKMADRTGLQKVAKVVENLVALWVVRKADK